MNRTNHPARELLSRRQMLRLAAAGVVGFSASGWIEALAADAALDPKRRKSCILLWMTGGPSQTDTFDPKPGHPNGGEFKAVETAVPGIFDQRAPAQACQADERDRDHSLDEHQGRGPWPGDLQLADRLPADRSDPLPDAWDRSSPRSSAPTTPSCPTSSALRPSVASIPGAFGPGFLGPQYAPLIVGERAVMDPQGGSDARNLSFKVEDLSLPAGVDTSRADSRLGLLGLIASRLPVQPPGHGPLEPPGCLLAGRAADALGSSQGVRAGGGARRGTRRLRTDRVRPGVSACPPAGRAGRSVRRGHALLSRGRNGRRLGYSPAELRRGQEVERSPRPSVVGLDGRPAIARAAWTRRLIVWMGEFGRTPKINPQAGRDHFPAAWTTVLAGGGIKGGQVIGSSGPDGMQAKDRPVSVPDFLATVCKALGVDPMGQNDSGIGRPIRIVDPKAKAITEVLA